MAKLTLPQKVTKTTNEGGVVFLVGEKMVSSDFGGATYPKMQTPGVGLPCPGC